MRTGIQIRQMLIFLANLKNIMLNFKIPENRLFHKAQQRIRDHILTKASSPTKKMYFPIYYEVSLTVSPIELFSGKVCKGSLWYKTYSVITFRPKLNLANCISNQIIGEPNANVGRTSLEKHKKILIVQGLVSKHRQKFRN